MKGGKQNHDQMEEFQDWYYGIVEIHVAYHLRAPSESKAGEKSVIATLDCSEACCCEEAFHYESDSGFCCGIYPSESNLLEILPNFLDG